MIHSTNSLYVRFVDWVKIRAHHLTEENMKEVRTSHIVETLLVLADAEDLFVFLQILILLFSSLRNLSDRPVPVNLLISILNLISQASTWSLAKQRTTSSLYWNVRISI